MIKTLLFVWAFALAPVAGWAQGAAAVQRLFEAGQYEAVIESAAVPEAAPTVLYLAAQSAQKRGTNDRALDFYQRLARRADAWRFIGVSGAHLVKGQATPALEAAQQAVAADHALPEAHYQLGLVFARSRAWPAAAEAFERAIEREPRFAYAYYYAGLAHYNAGRADKMANHFERFLKLAPEAPERLEVLQIMRTVRGR